MILHNPYNFCTVFAVESFKVGISGRTPNPKCNFGHWSKMILKSISYLLTNLQNGHNLSKSALNALKIEVFK